MSAMRKYIVGFIIGVFMTASVSAYADNIVSLVGKQVQGEFLVMVNGKELPQKAVVIDGSSYAPVRAIGESAGYDVGFDPNRGIDLRSGGVTNVASVPDNVGTSAPIRKSDADIVAESYRGSKEYKFTSTIAAVEGTSQIVNVEGVDYIPAYPILKDHFNFDGTTITIELDGKKVSFPKTQTYTKGIDGFMFGGEAFINVSSIGLNATVQGDTLRIEKL